MDRIHVTPVADLLARLGWTKNDLLIRVNNLARQKIEEEARLYSRKDSEQKRYLSERLQSSGSASGIHVRCGMSRATLYNILEKKHTASEEKAILIKTVLNTALLSRQFIKKELSYEEMDIDVYRR